MRADLARIPEWVAPNSRVLDLGCGDGELLQELVTQKNVRGIGVEIESDAINQCLSRGLNVIEQDLNDGLGNFADGLFDVVVMTQALQTLHAPDEVIDEMLRVGRQGIVSFPNFGNWRCRWHLGFNGTMPVSQFLPYTWYDTPNIHFFTVRDFETLLAEKGIKILHRITLGGGDQPSWLASKRPNLFAITALYHIARA